jgi:hypothetical protein
MVPVQKVVLSINLVSSVKRNVFLLVSITIVMALKDIAWTVWSLRLDSAEMQVKE